MDEISQQEYLNEDFTGKNVKNGKQIEGLDLFEGCEPAVDLKSNQIGATLHKRALWERQVSTS
jgi:hypothetical protein